MLPEEKDVFIVVEAISHEFSRKNKGYLHNCFLVDIATKCICENYDVVPFQLGAGQGKTFVALLLAEYHLRDEKRPVIVVPSKVLQEQFE